MRDLFPVYYDPDDDIETVLGNCVFVFDTNVLLHIYQAKPASRRGFFSVLRQLGDRIWLPHQVALEYQRQRLIAINQQAEAYKRIEQHLTEAAQKLETQLNTYKRHAVVDAQAIIRRVKAAIEKEKKKLPKLKQSHPDYLTNDPFRDTIDTMFKDKVGSPYSRDQLATVYLHAQHRFPLQIPPGYKDSPRTGDLIIWFQLLDYAKAVQKPIVFITDDTKEDWWAIVASKPRTELLQEMHQEAGVSLYMLLGDHFLARLRSFLRLQDRSGEIAQAIEEVREVREQEATASAEASLFRSMAVFPSLESQLPELSNRIAEGLQPMSGITSWAAEQARMDAAIRSFTEPHEGIARWAAEQARMDATLRSWIQGQSLTADYLSQLAAAAEEIAQPDMAELQAAASEAIEQSSRMVHPAEKMADNTESANLPTDTEAGPSNVTHPTPDDSSPPKERANNDVTTD